MAVRPWRVYHARLGILLPEFLFCIPYSVFCIPYSQFGSVFHVEGFP